MVGFHRVGKNIIHPFDKDYIEGRIEQLSAENARLCRQLATINAIEAEEAASDTR